MRVMSLDGRWRMRAALESDWREAVVPGSVYADLLENGLMDDPFYRDNELKALALMDGDYVYEREFEIDGDMLACEKVYLNCEGLDTICCVEIGGVEVGKAFNMHRVWRFDIKDALAVGRNTIRITFRSPTEYIARAYENCHIDGSSDAMKGFPHLRKAHCMFGWDWGPRLPDIGIWRGISIIGVDQARLLGVKIAQFHENGQVRLAFEPEIEWTEGEVDYTLTVEVICPDGRIISSDSGEITIDDALLWWPNGYGDQPLYRVEARLLVSGREADRWSGRVGLRTLALRREKDEYGESFEFVVNSLPIFAMGGDYIPEDSIFSRVTPERTRRLLEDCVLANHNCIRVWGGGYYPDDFFFDICDELGLIVWQDFMFSCAMYELTIPMAENIVREVEDNVRRIRHHACLGLWCANNELEWQVKDHVYDCTPKQYADYIRLFEYLIPNTLRKLDPVTCFWPSSPSSGGGFDYPNDPDRGDCHYWEVWHSDKPFTEYRKFFFRFASEFGFQSFPCLKTIESFTEPSDRNIFSRVMEVHQRNKSANGKIMNYLSQTYLYPKDFSSLIYASQLLQADAIRYGVEHWRRNRGRCMGAVYWQVNDCWPVASWSSIDYYGRWKALHYASKRFFAPILLSCLEEGTLSQQTNVNAEGFRIHPRARLCVTNDTALGRLCTVAWSIRDAGGGVLMSGSGEVTAPAFQATWLDQMDFEGVDIYNDYLWYELWIDGEILSSGSALFCAAKHFNFIDPRLTARLEGDRVIVEAGAFARCVEISSANDALFSDNYFDMNPGKREVVILRGDPGEIYVRSVWDIANLGG